MKVLNPPSLLVMPRNPGHEATEVDLSSRGIGDSFAVGCSNNRDAGTEWYNSHVGPKEPNG